MKKILFCLFILLFSCGCNATYNLEINNKGFQEELSFYETNSILFDKDMGNGKTYRESIQKLYDSPKGVLYDDQNNDSETDTIVKGRTYYNRKIINDNGLGLVYNYNFKEDDYERSLILNTCFDAVSIYNDEGLTVLTTSKGFNCYNYYSYLEAILVNVKIKYKVLSSNADSVKDNTYTWNITKDNASSKILFIKYKINNEKNPNEEENNSIFSKTDWIILVIVLLGLIFVGLFTFNSIMEKNRANNKL
jgi:hypothetical protein